MTDETIKAAVTSAFDAVDQHCCCSDGDRDATAAERAAVTARIDGSVVVDRATCVVIMSALGVAFSEGQLDGGAAVADLVRRLHQLHPDVVAEYSYLPEVSACLP